MKNLIKQNGDKFVFVENGEPEIVVMSFHEYQKLAQSDPNIRMHPNDPSDGPRSSTAYSDNSDVEFGSLGSSSEAVGLPVRLEDIRLEDLPI